MKENFANLPRLDASNNGKQWKFCKRSGFLLMVEFTEINKNVAFSNKGMFFAANGDYYRKTQVIKSKQNKRVVMEPSPKEYTYNKLLYPSLRKCLQKQEHK